MKTNKNTLSERMAIDWLGFFPEHWQIKRIKDVFGEFGSGTTPQASNPKYYENGDIPWLNTSDLNNSIVLDTKIKITKAAIDETSLKMYPKGSFAIAMYGQGKTRGTVGLVNFPFTTNQASCIMFKPKGIGLNYLLFWFNYKYESIRAINVGASQPNMNQDFVRFLQIHFPPLSEQTAIAYYLDKKTKAIDKKISLLEKKIGYYQELRKSLITETVTKGLDKSVKFKDSGIDWIGQIPKHWEVKRMKALGNIETSSVNKKIEDDEALVRLVNYVDVYNNLNKEIWNSDNFMTVSANYLQVRTKKLKKGDALFTPSSETIEDIGVSAIVMENLNSTLYSYHLIRLQFSNSFNIDFKKYMLNNAKVQYYFSHSATGTTRKILGLNIIYNLPVVFPPSINEQEEIARFLVDKTRKIDQISMNIKIQITALKELRKTLINDAVTGKIKVINN